MKTAAQIAAAEKKRADDVKLKIAFLEEKITAEEVLERVKLDLYADDNATYSELDLHLLFLKKALIIGEEIAKTQERLASIDIKDLLKKVARYAQISTEDSKYLACRFLLREKNKLLETKKYAYLAKQANELLKK